MRLGVPVASPITAFAVCCCRAEGLLQPLAGALAERSAWQSERTFREESLPAIDPCDSQRP
jgi:hypothetical protein